MDKKKIIKGLGIGLIIALIVLGVFYHKILRPVFKEHERVRSLTIENINLAEVKDGEYRGGFSYGEKTNIKVVVTVEAGEIVTFDIVENGSTDYAKKAAVGIKKEILKQQINNVDIVSGATTTSKAILKAVEIALNKGL